MYYKLTELVFEEFQQEKRIMKYVSPLDQEEIQILQELYQRHHSRWARMRAHSILLSHQKFSIHEIARIYQVDQRSVSSWIDRWQSLGSEASATGKSWRN